MKLRRQHNPHAVRRLAERTDDVTITELKRCIRRGLARAIMPLSQSRKLCVAQVDGKPVWYVYSTTRHQIVTVLPIDDAKVRVALRDHADRVPTWARWSFS